MSTKKIASGQHNPCWVLIAFLSFFSIQVTNARELKDNVARYNNYINLAELAIVDDRIERSAMLYDSAFIAKSLPFAVDLYNAINVNLQIKNNKRALQLCFKLSSLGVGAAFFSKSVFGALRKEKQWKQLLIKAAASKHTMHSKNKNIIDHIDKLVLLDQEVARKREKEQFDNAGINDWARKKFDSIASDLLSVFKKNGYLSEFRIGAHLYNDTTLAAFPVFDIIIVHNVQRSNIGAGQNGSMFNNMFRKALAEGNLKPDYLAQKLDGTDRNNAGGVFGCGIYSVINCKLCRRKLESIEMERIDNSRKDAFLSLLSDYERKVKYKALHPGSAFMLYAGVNYLEFANKQVSDRLMAMADILLKDIPGCRLQE